MFRKITITCAIFILLAIVLDAYVRVEAHAPVCPDWPQCFGQIFIDSPAELEAKLEQYQVGKAIALSTVWAEMGHRYSSFMAALLIILLALKSWREKTNRCLVILGSLTLLALSVIWIGTGWPKPFTWRSVFLIT